MILRTHVKGDAPSEALYSPCEGYRYTLTRRWTQRGQHLLYIMLNPSTATEAANDPTIERCERRARAMGFGGFTVCNIFAWRETSPQALRKAPDPVGPQNDAVLLEQCTAAETILCAWGAHGDHMGRGRAVERLLRQTGRPLCCLGLTRDGHPRHPLYISYGTRPEPWPEQAGAA
ncbi:DUF1643 domain-containing protein [Tropicimonas isoalkanivorans]|uniref:DUF1643 domain-containing protein n=1 Tax=Tropicimonas isoalkanivorans TaxID=441112 RepID=A0A1I1P5A8_9RHOB|nr:DUF1643 domain-containing protein [Tropicimonas isoalkanivorans]SFD01140.1 hypothetical protein SAMN04488094_11316 [Tropicimonas isoalkanivorans]